MWRVTLVPKAIRDLSHACGDVSLLLSYFQFVLRICISGGALHIAFFNFYLVIYCIGVHQ